MDPTWPDAIEAYLLSQRAAGAPSTTIGCRRQHLRHLARGIRTPPWAIAGEQLVEWAGVQEWQPETRRGRRTTFLSFWRWAIATERTTTNPAAALPLVKPTAPNPRPVPDRVYEAALWHADDRVRLMMRLAAEAGMRRAEIAVVHSSDLVEDLDGWSLVVHGKGNKARVVPLTRRIALELRSLPGGYAFPGAIDGHLSPRRVGELVTDQLEGDWTIHKLRHRAGTRWHRSSGGDLLVVQELLGHASPATTRAYVKVQRESLRQAVDEAAS